MGRVGRVPEETQHTNKTGYKMNSKGKSTDERPVLELLRLVARLVPERGQADTVQGEMVRAIWQLPNVFACRSSGIPTNEGEDQLYASFLRHHLGTGNVFDADTVRQIEQDLAVLTGPVARGGDIPQAVKDALVRTQARVVEWCRLHPELLPREVTEDVACAR